MHPNQMTPSQLDTAILAARAAVDKAFGTPAEEGLREQLKALKKFKPMKVW